MLKFIDDQLIDDQLINNLHTKCWIFIIIMFDSDHQREIQRLESLLVRSNQENDQLKRQLKTKDQQIQTLTQQNLILETAKNNFASSNLYTHQNSQALQQKISRLQKFLEEQINETDYITHRNNTLVKEVSCLHKNNQQNLALLQNSKRMIQQLKLYIKELQDINSTQHQQIEKLNKNIKNYELEKCQMIGRHTNITLKYNQEESQKHRNFKTLFEGLNFLKEEMKNKKPEKKQKFEAEMQDERIIFKLQHEELQERNEEIMRLRNILDGMQIPMQQLFLRNTIKHLRGELAKHNKKITSILEKQQRAEQLIKKYNQTISKYQKEIKDIANLKTQNSKLREKIAQLQFELKQIQEREQIDKKMRVEGKVLFAEILIQNQCCHDILFENYGSDYKFYIESRKPEFQKTFQERVKREKWTSVDELIKVNQQLRRKLKLI